MLAVVAAAAVFNNTCARTVDSTTNVVTYQCPLCYETDNARVLSGDGVVWHVGGGVEGVSPCPPMAGGDVKTWQVQASADIRQDPSSSYVLHGTLTLLGGKTSVNNVRTTKALHIVGQASTDISIRNLVVSDDLVAVRAYRGDPTGDLLNISGLSVFYASVTPGHHALALAHTTNDPITVACTTEDNHVVSQPVVALTQIDADSCIHTDLGDILNIYGRAYEVSFYNFNYKGESPLLESLVKWLAIVDAVLLLIIGTCHGSRASALRVKQD